MPWKLCSTLAEEEKFLSLHYFYFLEMFSICFRKQEMGKKSFDRLMLSPVIDLLQSILLFFSTPQSLKMDSNWKDKKLDLLQQNLKMSEADQESTPKVQQKTQQQQQQQQGEQKEESEIELYQRLTAIDKNDLFELTLTQVISIQYNRLDM